MKEEFKIGDRVFIDRPYNTGVITDIMEICNPESLRLEQLQVMVKYDSWDLSEWIPLWRVRLYSPRRYLKVIFNDPATILFVDGKKYISKAHDEDFDKEKGLMACLLKSFGISYLDLQRMIKSAKVQNRKEPPKDKEPQKQWTKEEIITAYRDKAEDELRDELEKQKTASKRWDNEPQITNIKKTVSPCGKHRGKPYQFTTGDLVLVRDCYSYKCQRAEDVLNLLNKELEICGIFEDDFTKFYAVGYNGEHYMFAGSELEPVWED